MNASVIDQVDAFSARHRKLLSMIAVGWFVLTCANYARFVSLPDLLNIDDKVVLFAGIIYNAIWWGFLYPRVRQHRIKRDSSIALGVSENG